VLCGDADEIDAMEGEADRFKASRSRPRSNGRTGGRSIYFRDPSGNSLEFAEPRIWGI
jgi:catechol 2,3-dioxygenase-like lactoylglutathione lyase family enzyme